MIGREGAVVESRRSKVKKSALLLLASLRRAVEVSLFSVLLHACASAPPLPSLSASVIRELKASERGFVSGPIAGLQKPTVMNGKDFVYTVAFSPDGQRVANSHLNGKFFNAAVWNVEPVAQAADFSINPYPFDVEALDFSPDGKVLATASRDGIARFFDAQTGKLISSYPAEEPLSAVAFHPSGQYLVLGSSKGLLTAVRYPSLAFSSEARAHSDEIRNLIFTPQGTLFSGGWDKKLRSYSTHEEEISCDKSVRVHFDKKGTFPWIRSTLSGKATADFALDAKAPYVAITSSLANAMGIDPAAVLETASFATSLGKTTVRLVPNQSISVKGFALSGLTVAICDSCVPPDVQGVLGAPFYQRVDVALDAQAQEATLESKVAPTTMQRLAFNVLNTFTFPQYINDFSVDRSGKKLGIAFSDVPAQRTRDIYQREKRNQEEPASPGNFAAIVDADSGQVLRHWEPHRGVVSTVAIHPDGQRLVSGGWDKKVFALQDGSKDSLPREVWKLGWSVRRIRFSPDGRLLSVGGWTPVNAVGNQQTDPSALLFDVAYQEPIVAR